MGSLNSDALLTVAMHMTNDANSSTRRDISVVQDVYTRTSWWLASMIHCDEFGDVADRDRWSMNYHGLTIASASFRCYGQCNDLAIKDHNTHRDFFHSALMAWVADTFQLVAKTSHRHVDHPEPHEAKHARVKDACLANTPWENVDFVHVASGKNHTLLISQYTSWINKSGPPAPLSLRRKRVIGSQDDAVPTKRVKFSGLSLADDSVSMDAPMDVSNAASCSSTSSAVCLHGTASPTEPNTTEHRHYAHIEKYLNVIDVLVNPTNGCEDIRDCRRQVSNAVTCIRNIVAAMRSPSAASRNAADFCDAIARIDSACLAHHNESLELNRVLVSVDVAREKFLEKESELDAARRRLKFILKHPES